MSQKEYHLTMASTIAELERQVTGLRREVEEMRRFIGLPQGRHSAAFLAWAAHHGVDPDDFVPQLRHTDRVRGPQVAGAENGASHTHGVGGRDELTASLR